MIIFQLFALLTLTQLLGCAAISTRPQLVEDVVVRAIVAKQTVLLGEVHDNTALHAKREALVRAALAAGARPALAFEQFDRGAQAAIDAARLAKPRDAAYLIEQAQGSKPGWNWDFYRSLVQLALDNNLPIIATNLSRSDAMKIATTGLSGLSAVFNQTERTQLRLDEPLPDAMIAAHRAEIATGHCNLLPTPMVTPMAEAQIARDAVMAAALKPHILGGVIFFAGNSHTRRDIGVPRWLPAAGVLSVGMLEPNLEVNPSNADASFDVKIIGIAQSRENPCIKLKARFGSMLKTP